MKGLSRSAKANLPTQEKEARQDARLSHPHENARGKKGLGPQASPGAAAPDRFLRVTARRPITLPITPKLYGFPKSVRLLHKADYRKVYTEGRRRNLEVVVAFAFASGQPVSRIGITAPRSVGGAVERNLVKRRLREAARKHLRELGPGWDIVLNTRAATLAASLAQLEEALQKLFRACASASGRG